ncbi:MAG TPA: NAD-binding protein [Chitinophagales bacterium]|nr:NAD-binding protein [Chitinophagales bacterium]HMZ88786.1 NAD-binding protein [Chitinophagales bacterium]
MRQTPFFEIYLALFLLLGTLCFGVIGYMVLEGYNLVEALYMTVITLGTVGFTEVRPLDDAGRMFTIVLILAGLVIFAYFITQISRYFLDGEFILHYKSYKMKKQIEGLKNHVIICGFGRNGREAARVLLKSNMHVVVIDQDESKLAEFAEEAHFYYIYGDATRDETLIDANITQASAILTTLPDDAQNVFVCLTAKELHQNIKIIARATHLSSVRKLKNAGATNVIMPDKIGGAHMAMLVSNPDIEEFIDIMATHSQDDFSIQEVMAGKRVNLGDINCWQKTGATVIGIKSSGNQYILNPDANVSVNPGDGVIIMGSKIQINASKQLFI